MPAERKSLRPFDLAVLWGDLAVSLLVMVAGSLLVPGLSTREAMAAILLGTALGTVLLALAGVAAQWAFPAADTIAGAKYAARGFLKRIQRCRTR